MRIWFDISNSPHVILFYNIIKELKQEGHEVIITTRPLANTIALLDQKCMTYKIIGKHYGKSLVKKIFGFPVRVAQLYWHLSSKNLNLAVGQSSFHLPIVARLLNISSIYTNDNEHASGNLIAFYFAHKILLPSNFTLNKYLNNSWIKSKIIYYPGVKEGVYLWIKHHELTLKRNSSSVQCIKIYIRPEPSTAQYYNGAMNFLDDMIQQLQKQFNVVILTRNQEQFEHYNQPAFSLSYVPIKPMHFDDIALDCALFIGAGGSMTREFALLGIPTISVYQDKLLAVDNLLLKNNLLLHVPQLDTNHVLQILAKKDKPKQSNDLLIMGKQAYDIFKAQIIAHNSH